MKDKKKTKVAIGMSGGVDSSVAAALLKEQGYEVIGVFMHFWSEKVKGRVRENICCSLDSAEDARRVCNKLGIPFYTINMKVPFKEKIVDDFIAEYKNCRTPNPCVRCNQYIKFEELWKKLKPMGVDYVATGHYAQVKAAKGGVRLVAAKDQDKDQTYFLHQIKQKQLAHTLFPVGHLTKPDVRVLAKKFDLSTSGKKESQEICFVANGKIGEFLQRYIKFDSGEIKDVQTKEVLGRHDGLPLYTIGQRKGIGLPGGPWYVVRLGKKDNTLWVSRDENDLLSNELKVKKVNWINEEPQYPAKLNCKIRYRSKSFPCVVEKMSNGQLLVKFKKPQRAVTVGQYCVFWKGKACIGGGVIV
jgi:tRNA-uridine 2-sulfurtransferase